MNTNLLAFCSEFESALLMDDPEPRDGGAWENRRSVNYGLGLARLLLGVRRPGGEMEDSGTVFVQSYVLADGSSCLRVQLAWAAVTAARVFTLYSKPGVDWKREARKLAAEWLAGPPVEKAAAETPAPLSLASAIAG